MNKLLKKLVMAAFGLAFLASFSLPSVFAQQNVNVSLPTFKITMNNVVINNNNRLYPIIVYKDITYVPMTYNDSRFLGLETKWSSDSGLQVNKINEQIAYNPNLGESNSYLESAALPEFGIAVNGKTIDNGNEPYPLLVFRDITYFPLTWRYMVNEFGWAASFDSNNGLIINSKARENDTPSTANTVSDTRDYRDFGNITVVFDRLDSHQPGNLYVRENGVIRKIGNPNYIYGVKSNQSGAYGEYAPIDKVQYANRWVYTEAIDLSHNSRTSKDVRINIDTNEVQPIDGSTVNDNNRNGDQFYSRQFGNITIMIDRASNDQPGNLYIKKNNVTTRIGNPNYIYGVSYYKHGSSERYSPIDKLDFSHRWVYTVAIDPSEYPIKSKNVRINIDTNEVILTE